MKKYITIPILTLIAELATNLNHPAQAKLANGWILDMTQGEWCLSNTDFIHPEDSDFQCEYQNNILYVYKRTFTIVEV